MTNVRTLLLAGAIAVAAPPVRAQDAGPDRVADSAAALGSARAAQAAFERTRIDHLPWAWSRGRGGCDETIGRFCYRHDAGDDDWEPPPEPGPVRRARERLIEALARAASAIPGDDWVVGQRVRYLVEAGRPAEARAVARSSRADPAWRAALEGYARHAEGAFADAEAAFDRALARLADAERRARADPDLLLDDRSGRVRDGLGPGARDAFDRRLWWLADPLWSVPGNERRSEHFARLVVDRMQADARSAWDVRWGRDLREILVRYGATIGWERVRAGIGRLGSGTGASVVGHEPPGGRRFVPPWEVLAAPTAIEPGAWRVEVDRPRSTYAPAYARRFEDLEGQVAAFRSGPRMRIAATWSLDPDSLPLDVLVEAALVVAEGPDGAPSIERAATRGPSGSLLLDAPARPAVASVEVRAPGARVAGRLRAGVSPPARVSDPLLLEPGTAIPATLEAAVDRARSRPVSRPGESVGIYLELYPPPDAATARVAVRVRDLAGGGFWRAVGRALGRDDDRTSAALAWEAPIEGRVVPVPFTLRWPDAPEGAYAIEVSVEWPDGERSVVSRRIRAGSRAERTGR